MKNKLKAFTITEVIVALAISSIVAAVAYYSFNTVLSLSIQNKNALERIDNLQELKFLMTYDFTFNHNWVKENNTIKTIDDKIKYVFNAHNVTRTYRADEKIFFFNKVEVLTTNYINQATLSELKLMLPETKGTNILRFNINNEAAFRVNQGLLKN